MAGFAFLFEVAGTLDGVTPVQLPSVLPAPINGVHIIPVGGNFGTWEPLDDTAFDSPTAYWLRAVHGEYSAATRAVRFDQIIQGTIAPLSLVPPVGGSPPLQELEQFPLTRVLPKGARLRVLNDSIGTNFDGVPVAGPHRIYVEIEPLPGEEEITEALRLMADVEASSSTGGCELELLDFGAIPDRTTDSASALQSAIDRAASLGGGTVCCPPGSFRLGSTVTLRGGVKVRGAGPGTVFYPDTGVSPAFDAQPAQFTRSELAYCQVIGPNSVAPAGIGIDLAQSWRVTLDHVVVWYFGINLRISDGAAFSAYHEIDGCEFNVSGTTNVQALANCNGCRMTNCRIFWSFTPTGTGIGLDVVDASSLTVDNTTIESADICVRVRGTNGNLQYAMNGCFLEPGINPTTLGAGLAEDIVVTPTGDELESVRGDANFWSANRNLVSLSPEGYHHWDHPSREFVGGRFDGASAPKRDLVRNGTLIEWGLPSILENWFGVGAAAVLAQDIVTFYTGNRSLLATATATTSGIGAAADVSDPTCEYVTFGIRYKVGVGNTGVFFGATAGFATQQLVDAVPGTNLVTDPWRVRYLRVRVNHASPVGSLTVVIDSVAGTGQILIDSIWCVQGGYATSTPRYDMKLVRLTAPATIRVNQNANGNEVWSADLLALPTDAAIAAAVRDVLTPPPGVIGALLRTRLNVADGAANTILANFGSVYVDIPANGGVIAAGIEETFPVWSERNAEKQILVRANPQSGASRNVSGGYLNYAGNPNRTFEIALVAWLVG